MYLPTCFPASLEQISPHSLPPDVYGEYQEFISWYYALRKPERDRRLDEYESMIDSLVGPLGNLGCKDVIFKRANTGIGLKRIVNRLLENECQVAVDIRTQQGVHTVGLIPVEDDHFTLVSNHVPPRLQGIVTLDDIMPRLNQPRDKYTPRYLFNNANVTALPPSS